jgi:hypothetical protein
MKININDINLEGLESGLIKYINNEKEEDEEIKINVDIVEENLKEFNERIINPSNINAIIKMCEYLMINCEEMKWLIINKMKVTNKKYVLDDVMNKDVLFIENMNIENILKYDMIEWLKFKFNECDKERLCENAARKGAIKCLKYAHENGCPWDEKTCIYAAENENIECLKYAHKNGCQWNEYACSHAAENGQLECLKYLHENGCPWDELTCENAAKNGHHECLKYAYENGCSWDGNTFLLAVNNKHLECIEYAYENGCYKLLKK